MPSHDIIDNRKQKLVDHINRILSSTEAGRTRWGAITADAGQGLAGLVYALYLPAPRLRQAGGLTEEEIRIVERGNT